jgi:hypothetical protein
VRPQQRSLVFLRRLLLLAVCRLILPVSFHLRIRSQRCAFTLSAAAVRISPKRCAPLQLCSCSRLQRALWNWRVRCRWNLRWCLTVRLRLLYHRSMCMWQRRAARVAASLLRMKPNRTA